MRLYTGPSLYFLSKRCQENDLDDMPNIDNLPEIRQADIIKTTFKILKKLREEDDETIE